MPRRHPTHSPLVQKCDAGMMPSPADPSPWESTVVLGNGETAVIRPLTPDGSAIALAAFHQRQSPDSIYRRYFSPKPELSDADLEHFTDVDMVDRVALVVESHGEFIAWASYERWPGRDDADAAFMVDDEHQGKGIATLLLEHLAAIARSNGIDRFTAEVLADNRPMLAVFAKAGWPVERRFESGVVDLDWALDHTEEFLDCVERREQRADSRAVARLLLPAGDRRGRRVATGRDRSVTRSGDTSRPTATGADVHAVNPARDACSAASPCHATVRDVPDDVSLAVVAVPARSTSTRRSTHCIAKRMRGAIVITSVDGTDIDVPALVESRPPQRGAASSGRRAWASRRRGPTRRCRPPSSGVTLPRRQRRDLDAVRIARQLAAAPRRDLRLGMSWFVSLGDKSRRLGQRPAAVLGGGRPTTRVIAMYTESFGNPRKFARIARRVSPDQTDRRGAHRVPRRSAPASGALYQQAGVIEVPTVPAMLDTARVLATQPHPPRSEHRRDHQLTQPDRARRRGASSMPG